MERPHACTWPACTAATATAGRCTGSWSPTTTARCWSTPAWAARNSSWTTGAWSTGTVADALAELDLSPADISLVINTHLHFDHCGQNAVFKHAPFYVQRAELDRARRESPSVLLDWFDFAGARFELLDGDGEILPGLRGHRHPRPHRGPPVRGGLRRRRARLTC